MNYVRITELHLLAVHIQFLRDTNVNNGNDDLIECAKDAYKIVAEQIGIMYIPTEANE
jgi:hypothetical protein